MARGGGPRGDVGNAGSTELFARDLSDQYDRAIKTATLEELRLAWEWPSSCRANERWAPRIGSALGASRSCCVPNTSRRVTGPDPRPRGLPRPTSVSPDPNRRLKHSPHTSASSAARLSEDSQGGGDTMPG